MAELVFDLPDLVGTVHPFDGEACPLNFAVIDPETDSLDGPGDVPAGELPLGVSNADLAAHDIDPDIPDAFELPKRACDALGTARAVHPADFELARRGPTLDIFALLSH